MGYFKYTAVALSTTKTIQGPKIPPNPTNRCNTKLLYFNFFFNYLMLSQQNCDYNFDFNQSWYFIFNPNSCWCWFFFWRRFVVSQNVCKSTQKVESVQWREIKSIPSLKDKPYQERLKTLKVLYSIGVAKTGRRYDPSIYITSW